ncbi:polyketide-type polyunsaturated fatty acid synthase PfaA [Singulisphaera sp. GP187]|uniref:type I polyketide synthase n=1 Tax=Singulisphaera sp. GP187 TaxID=1882752 RepID=UPI000926BC2E|nr:type I polyketide synthase [Singulisphaera sp. GP187]SIO57161.1 polyketide-type polyunsaturated fatty acid synthase PfaA [Singulisphaera sp. GP187]
MNSSVDPTQPVPVAIIGMGCLFPKAEDLSRYWANIRDRLDAITEVPPTHWRPEDYWDGDPKAPDMTYARRGGYLDPVDFPALEFGIAPNNIEATDTTQLLGLLVAREALKDAGYGPGRTFDRNRVSVILGVTGTLELVIPLGARLGHPIWRRALKAAGVADDTAETVVQGIADSYVAWQENSFPGLLGNVAAGRIANRLDLGGTNCVVDAACASSLGAVHLAVLELAARRSDIVLTGGLDTFNDIFMYMCFSKTPALSPTGDARPFDAAGDGTALGEGLGILALKRLDDAQRDGDKIYAVIRSVGSSSDGKVGAVYAPSSAGQVKALNQAYELGGISPASIELLEAHGTGTKVGDAVEMAALNEVYRKADAEQTWCALGSVKSQIGHTKAAAGAAGLIKAALALHHKVLPPTAKVTQPIAGAEPGTSPFYINTEARPWMPRADHPRRAAVSAFGFGGSNFHCVLEEVEAEKAVVDWDGDVQILAVSAARQDALLDALKAWPRDLAWPVLRVEAGRARARFQSDDPYRLAIVVERGKADLGSLLDQARSLVERGPAGTPHSGNGNGNGNGTAHARPPEGIYYATGPAAGGLAMLFPGQGAQHAGMLRGLACRFPQVHDALAEANSVPLDDGRRLVDLVFPHPAFSEAQAEVQETALRATEVAQPALGAMSLGVLRLLEHFGVRPDAVAGHSYGELTALCAAGRFDAKALDALSRRRGRLMADDGGAGGAGTGAMLAVAAPLDRIEAVVREAKLDVVIANKNAPRQAVLSGPADEIARASRLFEDLKITARPLAVSAAFHSRFVAEAREPFLETLRAVPFTAPRIPVYANTTASPYPDDPDAARSLLAGQLAEPVEFVAEVEAMHRAGLRTFLEVGPDGKLTGLVRSILEGREHAALAVDASRGKRGHVYDLALTLAQVAALGHPVVLSRWDDGVDLSPQAARKPSLTVKVCGANATPTPPTLPSPSLATKPRPASTRPATPSIPAASGLLPAPTPPARIVQSTPASVPAPSTNGGATAHHGRNGTHLDHPMNPTNGTHSPAPTSAPQQQPHPQPTPSLRSNDPAMLGQALRNAQDNLVALQKLGEQTSSLHRQFLDGQDKAQRTFQTLLEQQQRLTYASLGLVDLTPTPPAYQPRTELPRARDTQGIEPAAPRFHAQPQPQHQPQPVPQAKPVIASPRPAPTVHAAPAPVPARAPVPAPAPTPAPVAVPAKADRIQEVLLAVVSEKTGYPAEMLEPDMLLDADLGIDSIKRVEILAALQEQLPEAPVVKPEHLGTLRTLGQIVDFLGQGGATTAAPAVAAAVANSPSAEIVRGVLLAVVSEKTGYPAEMLEPDMLLDADLGIDSIKRVEILAALQEQLPEAPIVKPEHLGTLRTLGQIVDFLAVPVVTSVTGSPVVDAAPATAQVQAVLLAVVSEKTGYPAEMLEPDMLLDADLGIDSIKRVEILAALQEQLPEAPIVKPEHLGTLRTLGQIVDFLAPPATSAPTPVANKASKSAETSTPAPAKAESSRATGRPAIQRLVVTRVPLESREENVAIRVGGEVWIAGDDRGLASALAARLMGMGYHPRLIDRAEIETVTPPAQLDGLLLLGATADEDGSSIKEAFRLLRTCAGSLRRAGQHSGALLATVTRLDGSFGLGGLPAASGSAPTSGGLAGLAKTAGHEWPEVACKAIDLDPAVAGPDEAAALLLVEIFQRGPGEVGLGPDGTRTTLELVARDLTGTDRDSSTGLKPGDVVIITGGARGITAEAAVALAEALQPTIVLLGRSPEPVSEPDWLASLADEAEIKRALVARANGHATPQLIGSQFRDLSANREILANLERIEAAGSRVVYRSADVRDAHALHARLDEIRNEFGPIRALIHGAGVLADRRIEDQSDEQFATVFDTKVAGLRALLEATAGDDLRVLALFSSSTARFGRTGQVAYAAANEILNKWAQREARDRPSCRVVAVNWGPWDGGMVTPSLRPLFESEGIPLIPPRDGARYLVEEIQSTTDRPVEVVVLGPGKPHEAGPSHNGTSHANGDGNGRQAAANPGHAPIFERTLDLTTTPILGAHVIDGRPVLPMALILEWLAQGALQRNPGLVFAGIDDLRLFKGIVLRDDRPETIRVFAGKGVRDGSSYKVPVEVRGTLGDGREFSHAKGVVILADRHTPAQPSIEERNLPPLAAGVAELYRDVLFHGPDLQGLERIEGCDESGIVASAATAPLPQAWLDRPLRQAWVTDPLALDCAFQMLIVWSVERSGVGSLPTFVGNYRQFRRAFPTDGVRILTRITEAGTHRARADIEFLDGDGQVVARMGDYECVIDSSLNQAFRRNQMTPIG